MTQLNQLTWVRFSVEDGGSATLGMRLLFLRSSASTSDNLQDNHEEEVSRSKCVWR